MEREAGRGRGDVVVEFSSNVIVGGIDNFNSDVERAKVGDKSVKAGTPNESALVMILRGKFVGAVVVGCSV